MPGSTTHNYANNEIIITYQTLIELPIEQLTPMKTQPP